MENALDYVAMLLGDPDVDDPDDPDVDDHPDGLDDPGDEPTAALLQLVPDVHREVETHMARVEQLAVERDVLEAAIAAETEGEARAVSQGLLKRVEAELSELERCLNALAHQVGGDEGPLAWAISPRSTTKDGESLSFGDADVASATREEGAVNPARNATSREWSLHDSDCSDSDSDDWIAARMPQSLHPVAERRQRDLSPPRPSAGYARRISSRKPAAEQSDALSRNAEARAHTRALLEGGLGHAMKGLRPKR